MKNHVQLNPILADFKRNDIILLIYKAFYFTYSRKNTISAIFSALFFLSPSSQRIIQSLYFSIISTYSKAAPSILYLQFCILDRLMYFSHFYFEGYVSADTYVSILKP